MKKRFALGMLGTFAVTAGAVLWLERLGRRWGASGDEVRAALPGDETVPHSMLETTHAVTIHAPAAAVWPWLVQMGYGRAGWYTNSWWYRLVDRYVFHVNMAREERILPHLQRLTVGDVIPDGPPGTAYFTVVELESERTLALYSTTHGTVWLPRALRDNPRLGIHAELSWTFVLDGSETTLERTRLILRSRMSGGPALYRTLARALMPPADFLVARLMLRTIKRNAERTAAEAADETMPRGELPAPEAIVAAP
jgi:hypothetical protein